MIRLVWRGIYRGPRLIDAEYIELKKHNISTVVNLESNYEAVVKDTEYCKKYDLDLIWLPMSEVWPTGVRKLEEMADKVWALRNIGVYTH